jgi:hypothetical protein
MALTYTDSDQLMQDPQFRGRVKVAALTYAAYISNEAVTVPAHNTRMKWAGECMKAPDFMAQNLQPVVVMDPAVQQDGAAIADAALQGAVEDAINKFI